MGMTWEEAQQPQQPTEMNGVEVRPKVSLTRDELSSKV